MREGQALPTDITETKTRFIVEWNADYRVEGEIFTVREWETGTVRSIHGYPAREFSSPSPFY